MAETGDREGANEAEVRPDEATDAEPADGGGSTDTGASGADRHDELTEKRRRTGLSDAEAEELGRLMAERKGKRWDSARALREEQEQPRADDQ